MFLLWRKVMFKKFIGWCEWLSPLFGVISLLAFVFNFYHDNLLKMVFWGIIYLSILGQDILTNVKNQHKSNNI